MCQPKLDARRCKARSAAPDRLGQHRLYRPSPEQARRIRSSPERGGLQRIRSSPEQARRIISTPEQARWIRSHFLHFARKAVHCQSTPAVLVAGPKGASPTRWVGQDFTGLLWLSLLKPSTSLLDSSDPEQAHRLTRVWVSVKTNHNLHRIAYVRVHHAPMHEQYCKLIKLFL
jgi:hypothetical protein